MISHKDDIETIKEALELSIQVFREQLVDLREIAADSRAPQFRERAKDNILVTEANIERIKHARIFVDDMERRNLL